MPSTSELSLGFLRRGGANPPVFINEEETDDDCIGSISYSVRVPDGIRLVPHRRHPVRRQITPRSSRSPEVVFQGILEHEQIAESVREYRFHSKRQWRFDFAWPLRRFALEVDGIGFHGRSTRHQTGPGYMNDCEKYLYAMADGWTVLRIPSPWVTRQEHKAKLDKCVAYIIEQVGLLRMGSTRNG